VVRGTTRPFSLVNSGALVLMLASSLLGLGCVQSAHTVAPSNALTDVDVLLAKVAEVAGRRRSLSVEARVSYYGKEGARKAKAVILARRPAALHFSVYSPSDDMLAVLASDGEHFTSFERGRSQCYTGLSCVENIAHFAFFPLEGRQLVDALLGGAPQIWSRKATMRWDARSGGYLVELIGSRKVTQRIWVTHGTWGVTRMEVLRSGTLEFSIAFEDIAMVDGEPLPHTIEMKMPGEELDLRVRFREVGLNTDIADDAFKIPCPEGVNTQTLLCYDQLPDAQGRSGRVKWAKPPKDDSDGN
jgi:outer membrane lipoprotein-sorting protein